MSAVSAAFLVVVICVGITLMVTAAAAAGGGMTVSSVGDCNGSGSSGSKMAGGQHVYGASSLAFERVGRTTLVMPQIAAASNAFTVCVCPDAS